MTPESLLKFATAQGIDFMHHAAMEPPQRRRQRTPPASPVSDQASDLREARVRRDQYGDQTAKGVSSRVRKKPQWSAEEFAQACSGMPRLQWATLCFTIGGRDTDRIEVKAALLSRASKFAVRENWPATIRRRNCNLCGRASKPHYLEDLANLVLLEWMSPDLYGTPYKQAEWFGVSYEHWHRLVRPFYEALRGRLEAWEGGALGHIASRLREIADREDETDHAGSVKSA